MTDLYTIFNYILYRPNNFMHGHSFERICTKFGMWHPYVLRMVMGQLASAARARVLALRAPSVCRCKWVARFVGQFRTSGPSAV